MNNVKENSVVSIQIFGTKELNDLFEQLKPSKQRNLFINTYRNLSRIPIERAKTNLSGVFKPGKDIKLKKSMGGTPVRNAFAFKFGTRRKSPYAGHLGSIFDKGTVERQYRTKKGVTHRTGKIKQSNFWTGALDASEQEMKDKFLDTMIEKFSQFVVRANKKKVNVLS